MHLFDTKRLNHLDDPARAEQVPVAKIAAELRLKDGAALADIGCGPGLFSYAFAEFVKPHGRLVGFDIQQACIDHCEKKKGPAHEHVSFVLNTSDKIAAEDNSFDAALMVLVAHELPEPGIFFAEVKRILKPGARLALIEWRAAPTTDGPPLSERLSADKLAGLLKEAGFSIVLNELSGTSHYLLVVQR